MFDVIKGIRWNFLRLGFLSWKTFLKLFTNLWEGFGSLDHWGPRWSLLISICKGLGLNLFFFFNFSNVEKTWTHQTNVPRHSLSYVKKHMPKQLCNKVPRTLRSFHYEAVNYFCRSNRTLRILNSYLGVKGVTEFDARNSCSLFDRILNWPNV